MPLLPSRHVVRTDLTHLDDNAASEFVSGALPAAAAARIESHLAACRECRALVAAVAQDAAPDSRAPTARRAPEEPAAAESRPRRAASAGDRVGRYLVLSTLGAGGMGVVFAAYDPQLDRKVALKLLRAEETYNTADARIRLRREAQAIAQLSHPNVISVYDVGTIGQGDLYIAMELVEGDTLTTWLKKYPRTWAEIVEVFVQAARGIAAAHSVGLLHRDFKPDNVLVGGDGRVRVTDFGLARSLITPDERPAGPMAPHHAALAVGLTTTGMVLGTPRYMAPEQLVGPDIDARADQFSFCVALYEALYGAHPLPGATSLAMLEGDAPSLPPPDGTKVPLAIGAAVTRGLARDRARRFPTMGALISALAPAPPRPRARYALAALGALAIGGALAAAVRSEPGAAPVPLDAAGRPIDQVGLLVGKINELQDQLHRREAENRALVAELLERRPDADKIEQLQQEIAARNDKIEELVEQVVRLKRGREALASLGPRPATPGPAATPHSERVRGALDQAHGDLESCFVEWSRRQPGDADLTFVLTVTADGRAPDAVPSRPTLADPRLGPSLRHCVGAVLARVAFPPGPDNLDLEVAVQWSVPDHVVAVSTRLVGRRPGTRTVLDGTP
jgi:serine/threonine protein kinase